MSELYSFNGGLVEGYSEHSDYIEVRMLLAYPAGKVTSSNGKPFKFTNEVIQAIHDNYNNNLWEKIKRISGFNSSAKIYEIGEYEDSPIQKDHSFRVDDTIGRLVGKLWIETRDGELYLFGKARIKDGIYINKFKSGLIKDISLTVDKNLILRETSFVVVPALRDAHAFGRDKIEEATEDVIYDKIEAEDNNPGRIKELIKELKRLHTIRDEIELKKRDEYSSIEIESKLNRLVRDGIILRRDKKLVKERLDKFSAYEDKIEALGLISLGDKVINDKVPYNFNFGVSVEEIAKMAMENKTDLSSEQLAQKIKDKMELKRTGKKSKPVYQGDYSFSDGKIKGEDEDKEFSSHLKGKLQALYKEGKHKEMADCLAKHLKFSETEDKEEDDKEEDKKFAGFSQDLIRLDGELKTINEQISEINKTLQHLAEIGE